jgi:hypothetical protein
LSSWLRSAARALRRPASARGTTRDGVVALLLGLATLVGGTALEAPFHRMFEDGGKFFIAIADTHLDRGLAFTKGQDWVRNADNPYDWRGPNPRAARPYSHHPPGLGLSLAGLFALFGRSPVFARVATLAMHLAGVLLLILTVRRFAEPRFPFAASFAGLFAGLAPVAGYFGRHVCHEAWVGPPLLLAAAAYLPRLERGGDGTRREDAVVCAGMAVASVFDWPGLYLPPILVLLEGVRGRLFGRLSIAVSLTAVAVTALLLGQIRWSAGSAGLASLFDGAQKRASPGTYQLGLGVWLDKIGDMLCEDFTSALLVAGGLGIAVGGAVLAGRFARRARPVESSDTASHAAPGRGAALDPIAAWVALWLALGTFHVVAFPSGSFVHPYWFWYLLPALATAGGLTLAWLWRRRALLATVGGRLAVAALLFAFACESHGRLNRWYAVASFATGNRWLDRPVPPLLDAACAFCVPGFVRPEPAPGSVSRSGA